MAAARLRVGPESAGSVPGPACYGNGGTAATVTDANVVLGYLDAAAFMGGAAPARSRRLGSRGRPRRGVAWTCRGWRPPPASTA